MNKSPARILLIEDDPLIRDSMATVLSDVGYGVHVAENGAEGLQLFHAGRPDMILTDLRMPQVDGLEVLRTVVAEAPEMPIVVVSGEGSIEDVVESLRLGAWDYLTKPIMDMDFLTHTVEKVLERASLKQESRRHQQQLEDEVARRTHELKEAYKRLHAALYGTITAVSRAIEVRDPYTAGHERRVARIAVAIAERMGLDEVQIEGIRLGSMIHDIGKIQVPAELLTKPGRLSGVEQALVRNHAQVGYEILKGIEFPWPVAEIAWQHHERVDGSGYPRGLSGEEMILEARIVAVADVVEAMASHRPYRPAVGVEAALDELRDGRGKRYDAEVVDVCLQLFAGGEFDLKGDTTES